MNKKNIYAFPARGYNPTHDLYKIRWILRCISYYNEQDIFRQAALAR